MFIKFVLLFRFTVCRTSYTDDGQLSEDQRYERYDSVLCKILESLHKQGGHKETYAY